MEAKNKQVGIKQDISSLNIANMFQIVLLRAEAKQF